jgi:hypothetical protein
MTAVKQVSNIWAVAGVLVMVCGVVHAAPIADGTVIGIDFGGATNSKDNEGTDPTNDFNLYDPVHGTVADGSISAPLIDTAGVNVDGVGFTFEVTSTETTFLFNNGDAEESASQPSVFNDSNTTDWNGIATSSSGDRTIPGVLTFTFTGLDDSLTYDLIVGAHASGSAISDVLWEADGESATTDTSVAASSYVTLTGLSSSSGSLVITGTGTGASTSDRPDIVVVSAMHLTAVPEPSSAMLIGLGGLALLARRRRK